MSGRTSAPNSTTAGKFQRLIRKALNGRLEKVVAYDDRLVCFGCGLIGYLLTHCGVELIVISRSDRSEWMQELTEDLIIIVQHQVLCRRSGKRWQAKEVFQQMMRELEKAKCGAVEESCV